jgi:hypothetical protein
MQLNEAIENNRTWATKRVVPTVELPRKRCWGQVQANLLVHRNIANLTNDGSVGMAPISGTEFLPW